MSDASFPQELRIKSSQRFSFVIDSGRYSADATLVINAITNDLKYSRLGVSIPKKTGNSPTRNLWKRLVREAFRTQKDHLPVGFDFIVRPRRGAKPTQRNVSQSLVALAAKVTRPRREQNRTNTVRGNLKQ